MAPVLEKVAEDFNDRINLQQVNADESHNEDLMEQFDVRSIPTLVLIDEADKVLGKLIGQQSEAQLRTWLESVIKV